MRDKYICRKLSDEGFGYETKHRNAHGRRPIEFGVMWDDRNGCNILTLCCRSTDRAIMQNCLERFWPDAGRTRWQNKGHGRVKARCRLQGGKSQFLQGMERIIDTRTWSTERVSALGRLAW